MACVRLAFFEGALKPGREAEFQAHVQERLVPLWTRFPNLLSFRLMSHGASDDGAPPYVLVLEFTYASRSAMAVALQSSVRAQSREATEGLFEYFEGRIMHQVSEAADYPVPNQFDPAGASRQSEPSS